MLTVPSFLYSTHYLDLFKGLCGSEANKARGEMVRITVNVVTEKENRPPLTTTTTPKATLTKQPSVHAVRETTVTDLEDDIGEIVFYQPRHREESDALETRPWFCYLMKQLGGHCKNEANVKVSDEPYKDVCGHNRGDVNDKATKPARGLWQIELIAGPLYSSEDVEKFREAWVITSRGLNSRRTRCVELVEQWRAEGYTDLHCYDKRLVPHPLNTFLKNAGLEYLQVDEETYNSLVDSLMTN